MSSESVNERLALVESTRTWSDLGAVAEAVSVASEMEERVYVERRSGLYRWSLAHRGGGYPLLRITARFLGVDHHRIIVGFRTLPDGTSIVCEDPKSFDERDCCALLDLPGKVSPSVAADMIASALTALDLH